MRPTVRSSSDQLSLAATVGDLPFFPPEGVVRPHARQLHITLTLDPGDPGECALEPGDTLDLATVAPGRHRLRLHVRDQSGLVANDVRVIHVLTAAEGFALVRSRIEALQADPSCAPDALPSLAEAHALLAAALQRQRSGNVQGFVQKLAEAAGQLQLAGATESRAGALAETVALLVRDLLQPRVEYLETTLGVADPQVTPIRRFFTAGLALLAGGNFSGAILEFKKAQNRINALDTQSPEIVRLAPDVRYLQTGEFALRYGFPDFLTDIAPTSVRFEVDGVNRTAEATHSDQRLRIEFTGAAALPEGDHEFRLTVVDVQGNPATRVDRIWVDLAAPTAAWTSPAAGWVTSNRPLARLEYADAAPGSGIDPAEGVALYVDGCDVLSEALRGEEFATHQTSIGSELTEGTHVYSATVQDRAGRSVTAVRTFAVDSIPPLVRITAPVDGSSGAAYILDYRVLASDANGVALVSATINDQDATAHFTTEPDGFLWHPVTGDPVFLQLGENVFRVTVADPAGNSVEREVTFECTSDPEDTSIHPAYVLKIEDGDRQEGAIGQPLEGPPIPETLDTEPGRPLRVSVSDLNNGGRPVAGLSLRWSGSGFVVDAPGYATTTDAAGMAAVRYILGRTAGPEEITCTVADDPSVAGVTFHATAKLPTLVVEMPYRAEEYILLGSSEAFLRATLTRMGTIPSRDPEQSPTEQAVRVRSSVRVEVLDADGATLPDQPGLYVNPRSQDFNAQGQAGIDMIPDTAGPILDLDTGDWVGPWRVRVSVNEFPELPPQTFEFACVESAVRAGFMATRMLSGTIAGQIAVHDHPVEINVDMGAMRRADLGDGEIEHYTVFLNSPTDYAGHPVYEFGPRTEPPAVQAWFRGTWSIQGSTPDFTVRVRPVAGTPGLRPAPVQLQLLYQILRQNEAGDWEGIHGWQRIETVGIGVPEVRFAAEDGSRCVPGIPNQALHSLSSPAESGTRVVAEIRTPRSLSGSSFGATLTSLNDHREPELPDRRFPEVKQDILLAEVVDHNPHCKLYRSLPIRVLGETSPVFPTGMPADEVIQRAAAYLNLMEEGDQFGLDGNDPTLVRIVATRPEVPVPTGPLGEIFDELGNGRMNLCQPDLARPLEDNGLVQLSLVPRIGRRRGLVMEQIGTDAVDAWSLDGSYRLGPRFSEVSVIEPEISPLQRGLRLIPRPFDAGFTNRYVESEIRLTYIYLEHFGVLPVWKAEVAPLRVRVAGPLKRVRLHVFHNAVKDDDGDLLAPIVPGLPEILRRTNLIWKQAGMEFGLGETDYSEFADLDVLDIDATRPVQIEQLRARSGTPPAVLGGFSIFITRSATDQLGMPVHGLAFYSERFLVLAANQDVENYGTLAHELGHMLADFDDLEDEGNSEQQRNLMWRKAGTVQKAHYLDAGIRNSAADPAKGQVEAARTTLPEGFFE